MTLCMNSCEYREGQDEGTGNATVKPAARLYAHYVEQDLEHLAKETQHRAGE